MFKRVGVALVCLAVLAQCSRVTESRFNPLNWFGRSQEAEAVVAEVPTDPRPLVTEIISLRVEQVPGGAIVRAIGVWPRQGYFNGALVPVGAESAEGGVLNYEMRGVPPLEDTPVGTATSREMIVGRFVSTQTLEGAQQIRVSGANNALIVRR